MMSKMYMPMTLARKCRHDIPKTKSDTIGLFACFRSDEDKMNSDASTRMNRRSYKTRELRVQLWAHRSCPLSTSGVSKEKKAAQSVSRSVLQQRSHL